MRRLWISAISAFLLLGACTGRRKGEAEPPTEGGGASFCADAASVGGRIERMSRVDGAVAVIGFAPSGDSFLCSGFVVSPSKVVTAGHCIDDRDEWEMLVFFGPDAAVDLDLESIAVAERALHPSQDLAVLTLEEATDTTPLGWADPASDGVTAGADLVAVGYGAPEGEATRCLRAEARGASVGYAKGQPSIEVQLTSDLLCEGDSGGPLLADIGGTRRVVGVLATAYLNDGEECSASVTFTALSAGDAWIRSELGPPAN